MSFALLNLARPIFEAISACGYTKPTPVQAQTIPVILAGKDIVASAQTGTGKTAAFVLPALQHLNKTKQSNKPRILILTPTRELAQQVTDAVRKYGKFLRFHSISLVGGAAYRQQIKGLSRPGLDFIIATPGRLLDHVKSGRLDLSAIELLILDEADRMLDMGFIDDVKKIAKMTPSTRQTLLFSATFDTRLSQIVQTLLKNPTRIEVAEKSVSPSQIKQDIYLADSPQHKEKLLQHFLDHEKIYKAVIFSGTKINTDKLANQLCNQKYEAAPLHGDLRQNVRNKTIERFRRGKLQYLVATDVAARGIDISDVTHVFNYDIPRFSEDYVHRIGRTGRAGKAGRAISFLLPSEVRYLKKIEKFIGSELKFSTIPGLEPKKSMKAASNESNKKHKRNSSKKDFHKKPGKKRKFKKTFAKKKN